MAFYALLTGLILVACCRSLFSFLDERPKLPDGPRRLAFLGNVFTLSRMHTSPDRELLQIAQRWGDICMLWCGLTPVIVVNSPKAAYELMTNRSAVYSSRPEHNNFRSGMWPWRLITTPVGGRFRLLRKIYHGLLSPRNAASIRKYQDYESTVMLGHLLDQPEHFIGDSERFSLSVIFSAVYGVRLADLGHPLMREFFGLWAVMLRFYQPGSLLVDFFPPLQRLPRWLQPWLGLASRLRTRETSLHLAFLRNLSDASKDGRAPDCFGRSLLEVQEKEGLDEEKTADVLALLIGAGAETTSGTIQWFFEIMALHPEVVQKAQEELDRVVGCGRLPTWEDERALPYVRAVIKEVHRWAPMSALGVPHATTADDFYEGRTIPKGTIVFPNLTALNRNPEIYPNPHLFSPDRFLADELDASSSAHQSDFTKRDHYHYGFGRRMCQGMYVAEASLYIVIARVLWAFDVRAKPGHPLNIWAKSVGLASKPDPFDIIIESRGASYDAGIRQALDHGQTDAMSFDDLKVRIT